VAKGWVRASIDLWHRLCKVPPDSLLWVTVRESLAEYVSEGDASASRSWAGRCMHMVDSISQGRDPSGAITHLLSTKGRAGPNNDKLVPIPCVRVWEAWDAMLQARWDQVSQYVSPRQPVASNLIQLATYNSMVYLYSGSIPQEELDAGYPQGMPRYIRHTGGIPFAYVKELMRFCIGARHLAVETGRWSRP
jgi:hypothetical protein